MNKDEAFNIVFQCVLAHGDETTAQALSVLTDTSEPVPPQPLGALWNEATLLAHQILKTGQETSWETPPLRGRGMERLLHRFVCLLERFTVVLGEAMPNKGLTHIQATRHYLSLITVDPTAEGE